MAELEDTQTKDYDNRQREHKKVLIEYFRHLTTLSTGSIILLTTFLEKLLSHPQSKFLAIISILGFMLSVLGCVITQTFLVAEQSKLRKDTEFIEKLSTMYMFSLAISWLGFLAGVVFLSAFAIVNLL